MDIKVLKAQEQLELALNSFIYYYLLSEREIKINVHTLPAFKFGTLKMKFDLKLH